MKLHTMPVLALVALLNISAQCAVREPFPLWPDTAPGALGVQDQDKPTVTPYLPDPSRASGAAIVICPGGGYAGLAQHEGRDYALWLNANGVAGFVVKYRLGSHGYRHPIMLGDVARAVRFVRSKALTWNRPCRQATAIRQRSSMGGGLFVLAQDPRLPNELTPALQSDTQHRGI